ncbi:DUF1493 family protein [Apibacter muscae]|uniref:DUF1493 family protein n=1 Tax=Apibacter muscae TaxID=2509004 RepID=UPI0011ACE9D7|nr:DUF1493 family protein [Apibacter muscae]TWP30209.1 DUF1493 family protein [Apibacter muscae]
MDLTINNLLEVISKDLDLDANDIDSKAFISEYIDGYPAEDLLAKISKEFNCSFDQFDFYKYFHSEIEITRSISILNLLRLRKIRKVEKLSIEKLYEYMKNNIKP